MPLVLGVDSSTQSTKVELRDADDGRLIGAGRAPHPTTTPPRSEQDPDSWWQALRTAIASLPRFDVSGIAVAAQQMGLVALDDAQRPCRAAKLWNDTESAPESKGLVEAIGPAAWARACGSVPVASFTVTKLAWLKAHEPAAYTRLAHACVPHDWLTLCLTGRLVTDRGDASGTGWWSPAEGRYREDLLALVDEARDWRGVLPEVLGPLEVAGTLTARAREELGLTSPDGRAIVAAGTGDNMGAALGIGLSARDVVISLGTSGTVYALSDRPTADATGAVGGFADATGRFLPLVCTLNATKVTDAFGRLLGLDRSALEAAALSEPSGARGVMLVPYLDGERTPNRPEATGTLVGLRSNVEPAQLARAAFEGVVCGLLEALDALSAAGVNTSGRLLIVGGGAKSAAFRHIVADLAQRQVNIPVAGELVATGACVQAAAALHGRPFAEIASAWNLGHTESVDPDSRVDATAVRAAYACARG
ncbi:MAG: xylulokinase [Polyangiaceae bacterium]|jgi:xylulokinase